MSGTKAERLAEALNDFLRTSPTAEAAAVVSFDGLTMASALPADMDEERMGAMSAALLGLGEQAALGLGRGELQQLFVEGDMGFVFLMSAQDQAVLAVVTDRVAKIGFVLYEMRHAAATIAAILTGADFEEPTGLDDEWSYDAASYGSPVQHAGEPTDVVERESDWPPADGEPQSESADALRYEPGPIPADLAHNPYFLSPPASDAAAPDAATTT